MSDDKAVVVWIPGKLQNPKNWSAWGIWKHRRYVKDWRTRTAQRFFVASSQFPGRRWPWPSAQPKLCRFEAHVGRLWDDDGLAFGLVPVRDALKDMQLIQDDGPTTGHTFEYFQLVDRNTPGVRVVVRAANE